MSVEWVRGIGQHQNRNDKSRRVKNYTRLLEHAYNYTTLVSNCSFEVSIVEKIIEVNIEKGLGKLWLRNGSELQLGLARDTLREWFSKQYITIRQHD